MRSSKHLDKVATSVERPHSLNKISKIPLPHKDGLGNNNKSLLKSQYLPSGPDKLRVKKKESSQNAVKNDDIKALLDR